MLVELTIVTVELGIEDVVRAAVEEFEDGDMTSFGV